MRKIMITCFSCILGWQFGAFGQSIGDVEGILRAGTADVNNYLDHYLEPVAKGYTYSMGAGWIQSAKTHKTWGFHIKASVSAAAVPSSYQTFTFNPEAYQHLRVKGAAGNTELPTAFGPIENNPTMEIFADGFVVAEIEALPGVDIPQKVTPLPSLQAGLGIPFGTDILFRMIPPTQIEDAEIAQFGLGLKHDLKQHIPVVKDLPFSFSGLVAYNNLQGSYFLDESNLQYGDFAINSWTFQALVSKKFSILTLYGTLGYTSGTTDFKLLGTYEIEGDMGSVSITDPISLTYDDEGILASLGATLKFGPVFINGDYTFQEFNTLNVGLGVSIR